MSFVGTTAPQRLAAEHRLTSSYLNGAMKRLLVVCFGLCLTGISELGGAVPPPSAEPHTGAEIEKLFLSVPDPKVAEEDLRVLTSAPHIAGSPEDKKTADYVAQKFREAGLETEIVEYKVCINYPSEISVDVVAPAGVKMHGPRPERVSSDPYQDDPRIVIPFCGSSPFMGPGAARIWLCSNSPRQF